MEYRLTHVDVEYRLTQVDVEYRLTHVDMEYQLTHVDTEYQLAQVEVEYRLTQVDVEYRLLNENDDNALQHGFASSFFFITFSVLLLFLFCSYFSSFGFVGFSVPASEG